MTYEACADTPIGPLLLLASDEGLHTIHFHERSARGDRQLDDVRRQLDEYFAGKRKTFDVRLAPSGTDFQLAVWRALQSIPYGETRSYSQIANRIGRPSAVRAVGAANGANPIPIIVPCHRVIGANGSLTGFGGGLPTKRFLLDLEAGCPQFSVLGPR